jgi:hypothetical protein
MQCNSPTINPESDPFRGSTCYIDAVDGGHALEPLKAIQRGGDIDFDAVKCDLPNARICYSP